MKDEDIEPVKRVIEAGSNIAGAATGGVLGFLLGGVEGAIVSGVAGPTLTGVVKVLVELAHRRLSKREESRVGTAAYFSVEKIKARLESGEKPRDDGFFDERDQDSRSYADEIFEGTLLKSKNEHEEKKIRFIANIFATTAFHSEISSNEANHILKVAENMTYRQMCLLSLFERKGDLEGIHLATKDIASQDGNDENEFVIDISALQEIYQLYNAGLLACKLVEKVDSDGWTEGSITNSHNYLALITYDDVIPDQMVLTYLGKRYYSVMSLSEVSNEDVMEVAETLSS